MTTTEVVKLMNKYLKDHNFPSFLKAKSRKGLIIVDNLSNYGLYAVNLARLATNYSIDFDHISPSLTQIKEIK